MPAVTVDDVLSLPRLPAPDLAATDRPVRSVTTAPRGFEGEGFPVRRAFAGIDLADLDPFVHLDQMGEVEYAPGEPKGTPWHPHRGFETVTYMIDGEMAHQDSNGGGGLVRVIAGSLPGVEDVTGPGSTYTPITLTHATLQPGASLTLPWRSDFNALVYVLAGSGTVGAEGRPVRAGQLALLGTGDTVTVRAEATQDSRSPELDVLVLGGRPIKEPVAWYGPFVMNEESELRQAFEDFQAGKLGTVPAQH
jgi:redox-sensitive bicupin YhaK (pirin superfamily)